MALPTKASPATEQTDVTKMTTEGKIKFVVETAASRLPVAVGRQLLTLVEPKSLGIMAGVLIVWTGAQFFGAGEIADAAVLISGYVMLGGVGFQAARLLFECARLIIYPKDESDLVTAGAILAQVVSLIGVQGTLALLLTKPSGALKDEFFASPDNPKPFAWRTFQDQPTNRWWGYKPATQGVRTMDAGTGGTDVYSGDIEYSLRGSETDRRLALAHEQVHQFLTPKLAVLRQLRTFLRAQGYNRSYLLRYIEEALAETIAQVRVKGLTKGNLIEGVRFPIGEDYMVTVGDIKGEVRQIFLGPITVGGMTYQVWAARRFMAAKGRAR
jgi:hypothetical protein